MNRVPTIYAKAVEKITRAAAAQGVTAESLYAAAGLSRTMSADPDHRIPFAQIVVLYEQAAALTGDDAFGLHLGESVDPKVFDVLGYSVISSATFGEALDRLVRYNSIWTNGSSFTIESAGAITTIIYEYLDASLGERRHDAEMTLAAIASLARRATGAEWSAEQVSFQHQRPGDISEHERIFRCPLRFDAVANEFKFNSSALKLPLVKADPGLCAVLDRHAADLLAKYPAAGTLTDRVRAIIGNELNGGDASLERVARHLGLSSRTLQRKLREAGTSHQELLDQMRKDLALRYLSEPEMAICEVAYLLGFSESSALHRAFRRWTGMTPNEFRRR